MTVVSTNEIYLGNPNLKKAGTQIQFTKKQINEWVKCKNDPIYFATHYIKIISLDEGLVPFDMYDFQKKILKDFHSNRFNIAKLPRQTGKSTTVVAYLLFNPALKPKKDMEVTFENHIKAAMPPMICLLYTSPSPRD